MDDRAWTACVQLVIGRDGTTLTWSWHWGPSGTDDS